MATFDRPWLESRVDALTTFLTSETFSYIVKRLLQAILTLLLASALCFSIIQLAPGDYLDTLRENPKIDPKRIEQLRQQFGLDKSWIEQYLRWLCQILGINFFKLGNMFQWEIWLPGWSLFQMGNFGTSFVYNRSVLSLLLERVPATLLLAFSSLFFTWAVAIPLGIVGAVQQNRVGDRALRVISYIGQGFPSFITALLLLIFAQNTSPLFPIGDLTSIDHDDLTLLGKILDVTWHLILPTIALSITSFAGLQRITRGELLDVLRQDYIQTARAKGLSENKVVYVHALRNAVNPLITLLGFEFAALLSGAFITEFFFNLPGLGRLTLQAVQSQDLYLLMASLMMGAAMLIIGNLLADLLLKAIDPRIKLGDG
jgi:peptide/nickel transport system permease protein